MNILVDKRLGMLKTSAVAAACLTLMSFLVACGGGAGSGNSSGWEKAITPPKLTVLSPPVGPTTGGTPVAITGTDIQQGATVVFGNVPAAQINSVTSTSIEAVTPVHDPASVDVKVTNPDAGSDTLLAAFTFAGSPLPIGSLPPTISSVWPNSGPAVGGTVVTITGTAFQSGATVTFGQSPAAAVFFNSATQLQATTPAHAQGTVDVIVRNPDSQSATVSGGFTYQPVPAPGVSPASGTIDGGTSVTITGTGFQPGVPGTTVTFGGVAGTGVNVLSSTKIQVTTPAHAAGAVDVKVTNPDSQSLTLPGGYTYVTSPIITGLFVDSGLSTGGTPVTITGSNFAGGATVTFGTLSAASVNVLSTTRIDVTTPAQPAGTIVDVTVTNPDSQFGTLANAFRYGQIYFMTGFETGDLSDWTGPPHYSYNAPWTTVEQAPSANVYSGNYSGHQKYLLCGVDVPPALTLSTVAGGSQGARTYYVRYTYVASSVNTYAGQTLPSTEQSISVPANQLLYVTSPAAGSGLASYDVYASATQGGENLQTSGTNITIGTGWTEPVGGLSTGGASPPTTNAACGAAHDSAGVPGGIQGQGPTWYYNRAYLSPPDLQGFSHFFIRGFVKFHLNPGGAQVLQRKLYYLKDPGGGSGCTGDNCWHVVSGGAVGGLFWFLSCYSGGVNGNGGVQLLLDTNYPDRQTHSPCPLGSDCTTQVYFWTYDQWYYVEVEVLANTPGLADGVERMWVQAIGVDPAPILVVQLLNYNIRGSWTTGLNHFGVGNQADRLHYDAIDEERYWDNVVIGDAYIGPQVPPP
jgi:hypothetical protein